DVWTNANSDVEWKSVHAGSDRWLFKIYSGSTSEIEAWDDQCHNGTCGKGEKNVSAESQLRFAPTMAGNMPPRAAEVLEGRRHRASDDHGIYSTSCL
ncbi:hypothetical protein M514_05826, partial [Trichuris suis]